MVVGTEDGFFLTEEKAEEFRKAKIAALLAKNEAENPSGVAPKKKAAEGDEGGEASEVATEVAGQATLIASGMGVEKRHLGEAAGLSDCFKELGECGFSRQDYLGYSAETGYKFKVIDDKNQELPAVSLAAVLEKVRENGKKGLEVQRYKGLGEMNAEQLWETTMDPAKRTLSRVRLEDAYAADDMFKILMGDVVSARKEFIEQHALEVTDLDVR